MANTLSVMTNVLRNVVSKQRIRYKEKGFNLDLAYISESIIAMGYPADNIESIYRNRLEDVYKFLEENHHEHYKIYNLCLERSYDINKFHGRVAVYPFEDHNPPTIELIQKFCHDVDCWLKLDSLNVAAIHCKAGKGRTGTMICCYLLYSGLQISAEDALACYDEKRTKDRKGVTIPSQRRYVQYFAKLIQSGLQYERKTLQFCEIRFPDGSSLHSHGPMFCSISVLEDSFSGRLETLQTFNIDFRKKVIVEINNPCLPVAGDIKVELAHKSSRKKIFHFWFNTYFVCDTADIEEEGNYRRFVYTLYKSEIDEVHKDKEHKCFSENFKVQMVFQILHASDTNIATNALKSTVEEIKCNMATDSQRSKDPSSAMNNTGNSCDLNNICDQTCSTSASVCSLNNNAAVMECENLEVSYILECNFMHNRSPSDRTSFRKMHSLSSKKTESYSSSPIVNSSSNSSANNHSFFNLSQLKNSGQVFLEQAPETEQYQRLIFFPTRISSKNALISGENNKMGVTVKSFNKEFQGRENFSVVELFQHSLYLFPNTSTQFMLKISNASACCFELKTSGEVKSRKKCKTLESSSEKSYHSNASKIDCLLYFIASKNEVSVLILREKNTFRPQLAIKIDSCKVLENSFFGIPSLNFFYKITIVLLQGCIPLIAVSTTALQRILNAKSISKTKVKFQYSQKEFRYFVEMCYIPLLKYFPEFSYSTIFFILPLPLDFQCKHSTHKRKLKESNIESIRGKYSTLEAHINSYCRPSAFFTFSKNLSDDLGFSIFYDFK